MHRAALAKMVLTVAGLLTGSAIAHGSGTQGPLRVHPTNPRYFADDTGKAVLLVGSHTWTSLQDMGNVDPPPAFDWEGYLDFLTSHQHNFMRMWRWEVAAWSNRSHGEPRLEYCSPQPWPRTGPGEALDGKPKFDLGRFDEEFFARLRSRVEEAGERGIYVSVMLFEGYGLQKTDGAWQYHPFNPANNANGVGSDPNGDGLGLEVHELADPQMTAVQEAYVRQVIDTVNDLDNVLYEISNENHPASTDWQYHMIRFIHDYEAALPKQHPVGMTFQYEGGNNRTLFESPAEWVSPGPGGGYRTSPPAATGAKVVISDTDHLWGIGGSRGWVWMTICRGLNPIFMDPYEGTIIPSDDRWEAVRRTLGHARVLSERVDLGAMEPHRELASTEYCLAAPGAQYLAYLPDGGAATLDLSAAQGAMRVEWLEPDQGTVSAGETVMGGGPVTLTAPFAGDAVVRVWSEP
jgi:hypothetical protein